jgi:hypothetical protein
MGSIKGQKHNSYILGRYAHINKNDVVFTPDEIAKSKELVNQQIDILSGQFDNIEKQVEKLKTSDMSQVVNKAKSFIKS